MCSHSSSSQLRITSADYKFLPKFLLEIYAIPAVTTTTTTTTERGEKDTANNNKDHLILRSSLPKQGNCPTWLLSGLLKTSNYETHMFSQQILVKILLFSASTHTSYGSSSLVVFEEEFDLTKLVVYRVAGTLSNMVFPVNTVLLSIADDYYSSSRQQSSFSSSSLASSPVPSSSSAAAAVVVTGEEKIMIPASSSSSAYLPSAVVSPSFLSLSPLPPPTTITTASNNNSSSSSSTSSSDSTSPSSTSGSITVDEYESIKENYLHVKEALQEKHALLLSRWNNEKDANSIENLRKSESVKQLKVLYLERVRILVFLFLSCYHFVAFRFSC
jgi:hypothetical protein